MLEKIQASIPGEIWAETSRVVDTLVAAYDNLIATTRAYLATLGVDASETAVVVGISTAVAIVAATLLRLLRPAARPSSTRSAEELTAMTRFPRRLGFAAVVVFMLVFGGWSVFAPLASAAIAPGVISPDGLRKTIQHLEGGIIRSIHVREGDVVEVGDPLISLDNTRARGLDAEIRQRLLHVLATAARLEAEREDSTDIIFPSVLLQSGSKELQQVVEGQRQLLWSRRATYRGRTEILLSRISQLDEQNAGLQEVISAQDEQVALIEEEITDAQYLLDKGLERKPRVLALRRARADIAAARAGNRAKLAENALAVGETRLQLIAIGEERQEKIGAELADVRRIVAELRGQLPSREDILERTTIRAPISGIVMNVRATTESGVIQSGEPLLDLVPNSGELIIDARVRPTDIERVTPGMSARVVLSAFRQRNLSLIHGTLRSVSADALVDERSGESFFLAKVEVSPEDIAILEDVQLVPGMPAEVMLMDGQQTLFSYLFEPILDSVRRSLREN